MALDPDYQRLDVKPLKRLPANEPAPLTKAVVRALQALSCGEANPRQQQMALEFILNDMSGPYEAGNWSLESSRLTDFAAGRAFVGQQILGALKVNLAYFINKENTK